MTPRLLLGLLLAASAAKAEVFFSPQAEGSLGGGYSSVGGNGSGQASGEINLVPAFVWMNGVGLVPSLHGSLSSQQQALQENTLFSRVAEAGADLALILPVGDGRLPLRGGTSRGWQQRSQSEAWGSGLYDWSENQGGLGYVREGQGWKINLDGRGGRRVYPNYIDPSAELAGGKGYHFRDYAFGGLSLGLEFTPARGWAGFWAYSAELRGYEDSYLVIKDGTTDYGSKRSDAVHDTRLSLTWAPAGDWTYTGILRWIVNTSNQGDFDSGSNVYIPSSDAFDAESFRLQLGWKASRSLSLSLNGGIQNRNSMLPIRWKDGTYTQGKQSDLSLDGGLQGSLRLIRGVNLVVGFSALTQNSNQSYAAAGSPGYTVTQGSLGLNWKWSRF